MRTPRAAPGPSFLPHPPGANAAHEDAGLCQALCAPPTPCTAPHMGRIVSEDQASQPTLGGKKKSVLSRGRDGEIILTQVVKVGMRIIDFEVFLFPLKIGQQTMDIKWYFFTNQLLRPLCSC